MDELGPAESPAAPTENNVGLFLALYLLLLAFFIVLHSISQREEARTAAAIDSLTATFRAQRLASLEIPQLTSTAALLDPVESFRAAVRGVFERELRIARFDILQLGDAMRVRVRSDALFVPGEATLRRERAKLMNALADALGRRSTDLRFEVEFILGSGRTLPVPAPGLTVRRAGALARDLLGRGVAAAQIAAGVAAGDPAVIQMLFYARGEDDAKVTFAEPAT